MRASLNTGDSLPEAPPSASVISLRIAWAAGGELSLAITFFVTWLSPYAFGHFAVKNFMFLMLMEFLVVHSTGFMAAIGTRSESLRWRLGMYLLLMCFYALFAAAFSASSGGWWPLVAFLLSIAPKFPNTVLRPPDDDTQFNLMGQWAAMVALYLFATFATLMYDIPAMGVTPEVIASQGMDIGGVWPEEPYRVMAMGAIYCTGLALILSISELLGWMGQRKRWECAHRTMSRS